MLHTVTLYIMNSFLVDTLKFLAGVSTLNSQKLTEWIHRKVEGYSYHLVLIL